MESDDEKPDPPLGGGPQEPRRITSGELFKPGETEVRILHGREIYRLKLTKSGKLILTK